ncbi:MAG: hypothetical protein SP1CHLAM54_04870 [Chlamydiia bacterium]|nr:hypothetical protein [Chlamydiia bacterium]MCH9615399.1 hypothetical protein [Chlamydiia bacterium]MCH9628279.1 hypothetical protein [Chlamydiia bacterium]
MKMSKKRAKAITLCLFFLGLAILTILDNWWPSIMLVIGIPLAMRQYFMGRYQDMIVSLIVFIGIFVTGQFNIPWNVLLPIFFIVAALWILGREFLESRQHPEEEELDEIAHDIEEKD